MALLRSHVAFWLALLLWGSAAALPAEAQEFGRFGNLQASGVSYHTYVNPGDATVQVQVIGNTGGSGLYEVSADMDLGRLLALTGGPVLRSPNPNVSTEITVRLYRLESGGRTVIYAESYEDVLEEPSQYPQLRDGDVITVETVESQNFTWQNALSIVGSVASVLFVLDRLFGFLPGRGN